MALRHLTNEVLGRMIAFTALVDGVLQWPWKPFALSGGSRERCEIGGEEGIRTPE
jgi:hypothetical protein